MLDTIYPFDVQTAQGETVNLGAYQGKVTLLVNVASKCGFTSQYGALEALYQEFGPDEFVVLGFPCNQFGGQEPGDNDAIQRFCKLTYDVTFPVFAKVDVNGKSAHPLFAFLTQKQPGLLGSRAVKWNFTKFLVDRQGVPAKRYAPTTPPDRLRADILRLLGVPNGNAQRG